MTFLPYITVRKIFNLLLNEFELKTNRSKIKSYPPFIKIDPSPVCNLRCTDCKQNSLEFKKRFNDSMNLTMENLKKVIEPLYKNLLGVSFCVNGEPFSNKELTKLIAYLHSKKISVNFPTNFSFRFTDEEIDDIVKSGLDKIYVSLDGASEESYLKYRVGGNFSQIIDNVNRLNEAKQKLNSKTPIVVWKFVVFEHNKDEVEEVKRKYKDYGFDSCRFDYDFHGEAANQKNILFKTEMISKKKNCYWVWNTLAVLWDGRVYPCCNWYFDEDIFKLGNAFEKNIKEIWFGEVYRKLRSGFNKSDYGRSIPDFCKECIGMK
ncbi:MAG: radical SAM protein [Candidatus Kapabacteria bacterium]|nr:radical SAM protein [Candidatus Kapabacteria bacterium]